LAPWHPKRLQLLLQLVLILAQAHISHRRSIRYSNSQFRFHHLLLVLAAVAASKEHVEEDHGRLRMISFG
jgi:hypothetical protein